MGKTARYISAGIFSLLAACMLFISLSISAERRKTMTCSGLEVTVSDSARRSFVTPADINDYLDKE